LIPYVTGGGGVASVSQAVAFAPIFPVPFQPYLRRFPPPGLPPGILGGLGAIQRSETDLALTVGGGVDFQVLGGFAVGSDVRYLRLFGTFNDLDLTRITGRVTYRF
jgi:opacity protein-like surface antigen